MTARLRRLWRMRFLRYLVGVLLVLFGSYVGMRTLAESMADSVEVMVHTAQDCCHSARPLVFTRAIANARTARQVQAAVNSTLVVARPWDLNRSFNCELGYNDPVYVYHLEFRVHGIVVEVADKDTSGCGFWNIATLGTPPPGLELRVEPGDGLVLTELHQLTGMPIPQPLLG